MRGSLHTGVSSQHPGEFVDDSIIYNNGKEWLVVHGGGETMERLQESATRKKC